jgi:fibronectin type 3 domain-containing protein
MNPGVLSAGGESLDSDNVIDLTSHTQKYRPIILLSFVPFFFFLVLISTGYPDQIPSVPANIKAFDTPDDGGNSITVEWDGSGESDMISYTVLRASVAIGDMEVVETIPADSNQYKYVDNKVERGNGYYYMIQARDRALSYLPRNGSEGRSFPPP